MRDRISKSTVNLAGGVFGLYPERKIWYCIKALLMFTGDSKR